jgi:hypothetical protein
VSDSSPPYRRWRLLAFFVKEEKISLSPDSKLEFEAYNFLSYTAAVRRASLDLTKALADLRMDR